MKREEARVSSGSEDDEASPTGSLPPSFSIVPSPMFGHGIMYMSPYLPPRGPPGCPTSILDERRKRNRTFIDPVTEVPRLENWFGHNTHPSHAVSYRMNPLRIRCKVSNTTSKFVFSLLRSDRKFVHSTAIHPRDYLVSIGKKKLIMLLKSSSLYSNIRRNSIECPIARSFPVSSLRTCNSGSRIVEPSANA